MSERERGGNEDEDTCVHVYAFEGKRVIYVSTDLKVYEFNYELLFAVVVALCRFYLACAMISLASMCVKL